MKRFRAPLFLMLWTVPALAQETPHPDSTQALKEVIIQYRANKTTPVTFQNISAAEINAKSTGQEPSFLLTETPSITNYSDAGSTQGYSYFRMRGIDQTRVNITLDGVPLNEPEDQGAYFSNYPDIFNSVSQVQIQRGVGTSKNGVASYGGSLQLFSPMLGDTARTSFGLGYGSFNSLRAFGEYNSGVKNRKAFYARASEVYSGGYKYHSSNHSQSVFLSGGLFYDKSIWKMNLLAGHQQNQLAWLGVSDSLIALDRRTNANDNERDKFTQCLAQLLNSYRTGPFSTLQSSAYYTFLKGNYDFNLNSFLGLPTTGELYNYAFRSNLLGFFSNYTYAKRQLELSAGVHGNIYARRHTGSEKTLGQLYQNTGHKNEISAFAKAAYTVQLLTFFADVQFRNTAFDYDGAVRLEPLDWQFINPKAGVSAALNNNSVLYYSIGRTGREPTRNDLFGGNDDLPADSLGNPLLSIQTPEYVTDHELGFRHQLGQWQLGLNLYYMDFQNEIVLDGKFGPNGLALTSKVDKSYRTGIELSAAYQLSKNFSLLHNSSFNYSRIREQEETFSPILTPPLMIYQEAVYTFKGFSAALAARYQDKSFIDFANTSTVKQYLLLNARIGYTTGGLQFNLFLNNLTNSKYINNGYIDYDNSKKYFVQAPANLYASLKYSF